MTLGLPVYVPFSCDIFPSALVSSNDFVIQIHTTVIFGELERRANDP
jgi:hypothetical protein